MRPGALAAVAVVAAFLGGTTTLLLSKAAGWIDGETPTVLVQEDSATPASDPAESSAAAPLAVDRFDPAAIYAERAAGVVTIYALFEGHGQAIDEQPRVPGSSLRGAVTSSPTPT